jgi:hypothetical protein
VSCREVVVGAVVASVYMRPSIHEVIFAIRLVLQPSQVKYSFYLASLGPIFALGH